MYNSTSTFCYNILRITYAPELCGSISRVKASKKLATFLFKFNPRGGPIEPHLMKQTGILSRKIPEIVQY